MIIGVLNEWFDKKVGLVPSVAKKLIGQGYEIMIESDAGESSYFANSEYEEAGARIAARNEVFQSADILITYTPVKDAELSQVRKGSIYISHFQPYIDNEIAGRLKELEIRAFSLDMIPRSSLAQSMDVLSSMSSIAGYKAVIRAADLLPKYFPMMITSAGSIKPAKVLVIGAGVAGLQAIATAKRLGAVVEAVDTRPETEEQVKSLGGKFLKVEGAAQSTDKGYGAKQTEEVIRAERQMMFDHVTQADAVICTATVRSKTAPIIVTEEMVKQMARGSVIIDLASSIGGNCALTEDNKTVEVHGVTIIGDSNLSDACVIDASKLFSNNIYNFLNYVSDDRLAIRQDTDDEILNAACITRS